MSRLLLPAVLALLWLSPVSPAFAGNSPCPERMRASLADTLNLRSLLASQLCPLLSYADSAAVPVSLTMRGPSRGAIEALRDSLGAWGYAFGPPREVRADLEVAYDSVATAEILRMARLVQGADTTGVSAALETTIHLLVEPPGWYISGELPAPSPDYRDRWIARLSNLLQATACQLAGASA